MVCNRNASSAQITIHSPQSCTMAQISLKYTSSKMPLCPCPTFWMILTSLWEFDLPYFKTLPKSGTPQLKCRQPLVFLGGRKKIEPVRPGFLKMWLNGTTVCIHSLILYINTRIEGLFSTNRLVAGNGVRRIHPLFRPYIQSPLNVRILLLSLIVIR
jgi:hypothetical protein